MAEVAISIDGVDITADVVFSTARFKSQVNGKAGEAYIRVRDYTSTYSFDAGADWLLTVNGDAVWRGFVTQVIRTYIYSAGNPAESGLLRFIDLKGADLNILLDKRVVFKESDPTKVSGTQFPPGTPDTTAITELLANWLDLSDDDLDTTSAVDNVGDLDPEEPTRAWSAGWTWGQAMASIATLPVAIYYIRPEAGSPKGALVYCDQDVPSAPFDLSDVSTTPTPATYQDDGVAPAWQALHSYSPGDIILGDTGYVWYCDTIDSGPQESGAVEPDWDIGSQPVFDGGGDIAWGTLPLWDTGDWSVDYRFQPTTPNSHSYVVIVEGDDIGPEPTWPTDGGTVQSNPGTGTFVGRYREMEYILDGTGLANDVMGWGMGYGSQQPVFKRNKDTASIDEHGLWQQGIVTPGVYKQGTINRIVESTIDGSPFSLRGTKIDRIAIRLVTYDPGLLAGYVVLFESQVWGQLVAIPIREMLVTFESPENPRYELLLSFDTDAPWSFLDQFWPKIPGLPVFNPQLPGLPQQGNPCRECVTPEGPVIVEADYPHVESVNPDWWWSAVQYTTESYGSAEVTYGPETFSGSVVEPRLNTGVNLNNVLQSPKENDGVTPALPSMPTGTFTWLWSRVRAYTEWTLPENTTSVHLFNEPYHAPYEDLLSNPSTTAFVTVLPEYPEDPGYIFEGFDSSSFGWVIDRVEFTGDPSYGTTGTGIASYGASFPDDPSPYPQAVGFSTTYAVALDLSFDIDGDEKFQIALGPTTTTIQFTNTDFGIFFPPNHAYGETMDYGEYDKLVDYPSVDFDPHFNDYTSGGQIDRLRLEATYFTTEEVQEFTVEPYEPGTLELVQNGEPFTDFYESDPAGGKFQVPVGTDATGLTSCYTLADCVEQPGAPASPSGYGCSQAARVTSTTYRTPSRYQSGATFVWVNGLFQARGSDYNEDSDHRTLTFSDSLTVSDAVIACYYAEVSTQ